MSKLILLALFLLSTIFSFSQNNDGYDLWLHYEKIVNDSVRLNYNNKINALVTNANSPIIQTAINELQVAVEKMLDKTIEISSNNIRTHCIELKLLNSNETNSINEEGYQIITKENKIVISAIDDKGILYGSFHFIRLLQKEKNIDNLNILENPKIMNRILNHWDNLDRTVERGYAGFSIFNFHELPEFIDQRYIDYARANASIGINGTVVTNVNANALILREDYLDKVKALADVFRDYGIKIYLTARFSAPIELGKMKTADPLDPQVQQWWKDKAKEIYRKVPDFGGFLVKANSEGQPGPQDYNRNHADGANMLADAVAPFKGIVMWRAFVYSHDKTEDRAKQAYNEFLPLDGKFRKNVLIQVKNGAIDFQPREPFHPLFGALKDTPIMMEFQITKEYLGQGTHLVGLATQYEEVLNSDTYSNGRGSTVAKVIDGSAYNHSLTGIAGVANIGTSRNWTGHLFGQADWYAFGRLAWNPYLTAEGIYNEWTILSFPKDSNVQTTVSKLLHESHEICVNYMTPLGLHHIMAEGHHYGPGPWVDDAGRDDWNSVYYHKADVNGVGFNRTQTGSNALIQYQNEVRKKFENEDSCPMEYLLWFHHVSWDKKLSTQRTVWEEIIYRYYKGANQVKIMKENWMKLENKMQSQKYNEVLMHLIIQEKEAKWWRDACVTYFQSISKKEIPPQYEKPSHDVQYYKSLSYPFSPGIKPKW